METIKLMVNLLLQMLLHDPDYALQFEIPARKLPVRMWYMYKNKVCTKHNIICIILYLNNLFHFIYIN